MEAWTKNNLIFIMASKGYNRTSIESQGIKVFQPYRGNGFISRILREICFRIPFLPKTVWYNTSFIGDNVTYINLYDVLITKHYLVWLKKHFPNCRINYLYNNMVGRAKNLLPDQIPEGITAWTYDDYDSRKYNIRLYKNYWINDQLFREKQAPEFDVFFIGRDKGRGEELLMLEKKMQGMGLKTRFIITKDGKLSKRKPYYQPEISYDRVLEYDSKSRAILNITMENQEGITLRDMESLVVGVKLITTNRNISSKDLYDSNNVFILGKDELKKLPEFLNREYRDILSEIRSNHTFDSWMNEINA